MPDLNSTFLIGYADLFSVSIYRYTNAQSFSLMYIRGKKRQYARGITNLRINIRFYDIGELTMTSKELIRQAFELYYIIRVQKHWASERSVHKKRLHLLGLRAFQRYIRRQKAEESQNGI